MSNSSEFSDSVKFAGATAPDKSFNFSQTCTLLSQYLKEKCTFGDLSLGMSFDGTGTPVAATTSHTMNLFPMAPKSGESSGFPTRNASPMTRDLMSMDLFPQHSGFGSNLSKEEIPKMVDFSVNKPEPETAQMTIFYDGKVCVFNDFPADKAKEVMLLASKASSENPSTFASTPAQKPTEPANLVPTSPNVGLNFGNNMIPERAERPPQHTTADLPIARKASLTRFLEKRKDRVTARAPYQTSYSKASPPIKVENKSWLGLAPQSPPQFEHQS
uniref:Protein TIFY n=1 Tax=Maesa lanceolata TaxID=992730 RepID=G4WT71_MAELA|nr:JAZ1 [Maesa lanceolata]